MKKISLILSLLLAGCVVEPAGYVVRQSSYQVPPAYQQSAYQAPNYQTTQPESSYQQPAPVVSVYIDPPLEQPEPILVDWAPPPMLVENVPPMPYQDAVWIGGYWVWQGDWVWAHGRWLAPPRPRYHWVNPYYEHRHGAVVFVNGFWAAPEVDFVAPPFGMSIAIAFVGNGVRRGERPHGPEGVFVPAPPGSHTGLIVPAPIGTPPAVVISAPPIVNVGMRITNNGNNSTTNFNNVIIAAPANSTANGAAFSHAVPAQPHLAAAMTPVTHAYAPEPTSNQPVPNYSHGRQVINLPPAQMVNPTVNPTQQHWVQTPNQTQAPSQLDVQRQQIEQQRQQQWQEQQRQMQQQQQQQQLQQQQQVEQQRQQQWQEQQRQMQQQQHQQQYQQQQQQQIEQQRQQQWQAQQRQMQQQQEQHQQQNRQIEQPNQQRQQPQKTEERKNRDDKRDDKREP